MRLLRALALMLLVGTATACSDTIETTPLPAGVSAHIDQSRVERKGREVFLRVENGTQKTITVTSFELTSPRLDDVMWSGREVIKASYQRDLEFDLPTGTCGASVDATVTMTYRIGEGDPQQSTTGADDPYGAVALLADRDCAQSTLEAAASIDVGEPVVDGTGRDAVLHLPVTFTPTGEVVAVSFGGFGSTVLFTQTASSPTDVDVPVSAGGPPTTQVMSVVPARCDPHALAEDKVGTLFDVAVRAPGLAENASFYLPLTKGQRSAFFAFFRASCGLD